MLSTSLASLHKKKHTGDVTNPKFYENDFMATKIKEIEYIRSPFYELSKSSLMTSEGIHNTLDDFGLKLEMIDSNS